MAKKFTSIFAAITIILSYFSAIAFEETEKTYTIWENDFDTGYAEGATAIQGFDTFSTITPAGGATPPSNWDGTYQYGGGRTNYNGKVVRKVEDGNGMMSFQHSGAGVTDLFVTKNMGVISEKPKLVLQYRARVTKAENTYYNLLWRDDAAPRMSGPTIQGYQKKIVKYDNSGSSMQHTVGQWYDIAVFYDNETNTRKTYIDGEYKGEANNTKATYYQDGRAIFWLEANGLDNATTIDVDDIRLYKCDPAFDFTITSVSDISLSEFYLEFNRPLSEELRSDQILIGNQSPDSVEKTGSKYKLIFSPPLSPGKRYPVVVSNVENLLDSQVLNVEKEIITRAPEFFARDMIIRQNNDELKIAASGMLYLHGELNNELDQDKTAAVFATQYDHSGKMIGLYAESIPVTVGSNVLVDSSFEAFQDVASLQAFAWEGEEEPIPISGLSFYSPEGRLKSKVKLGLPAYQKEPNVSFGANSDYTAFEISIDTGETKVERFVGILIQDREGTTVHASQGITDKGRLQVTVPADYTNVGTYTLKIGVSGGSVTTTKTDYYSPNYIQEQMQTAVNGAEADSDSIANFLLKLGEYLGLDLKELEQTTNQERIFQTIFNIRETKEGNVFVQISEIVEAFHSAIKMNRIYNGKDTVEILSNGQELGFDADIVSSYLDDISDRARAYVALKLKNATYATPDRLEEDVLKFTILGGVYQADNYKQVRKLIKSFGASIGINMGKYNALRNPDYVETNLAGLEYSSMTDFTTAANRLIEKAGNQSGGNGTSPSSNSGTTGRRSGGNTMSFPVQTMPPETPTVQPTPEFIDVVKKDWFYEPVMWGAKKGLFIGTGNGRFMPNATLTWEQITIVLSRMDFEFYNEQGSQEISRGDFAKLLFRFLAPSTEGISIEEWIVEKGLLIGNEAGDLMLDKTLTRAECCTILRRIEQ